MPLLHSFNHKYPQPAGSEVGFYVSQFEYIKLSGQLQQPEFHIACVLWLKRASIAQLHALKLE